MPNAQFTAMDVPGARESEANSGGHVLQSFSGTLLRKRLIYFEEGSQEASWYFPKELYDAG